MVPTPRLRCRLALTLLAVLPPATISAAGAAATPPASAGTTVAAAAPLAAHGLAARFCEALHGLPETRRSQCCGQPPAASLAGECTRTLTAALQAGRVQLEARAVAACEQAAATALSRCDWVTPLLPRLPEACSTVVQGARTAGEPCDSALDCAAGSFCRRGRGGAGVCAPPGAPGASCGQPADDLLTYTRAEAETTRPECAGGYCFGGRCSAWSQLDGPCLSSRQCAPGSHCADRKCRPGPYAALGAPCTQASCGPDAACQQGGCAPLKAAGESCSQPFECRGACNRALGEQVGRCGMSCRQWPVVTPDMVPPPASTPAAGPGLGW